MGTDLGRCAWELPSKSPHRTGRQCNHDAVKVFLCSRWRIGDTPVTDSQVAYGICEFHAEKMGTMTSFMPHRNAVELVKVEVAADGA